MVTIESNILAQHKAVCAQEMAELQGQDALLIHNYAVTYTLIGEQIGNQDQKEIQNDTPYITVAHAKTIVKEVDSKDQALQSEALCYVLSITAIGNGLGLMHPNHFLPIAQKIQTDYYPEEEMIGVIIEDNRVELAAAWGHSHKNGSTITNFYPEGFDETIKKQEVPENIESLRKLAIEAFKKISSRGSDIAFPIAPHVLHQIGISTAFITFLHDHHIIRLVCSPSKNQFRYTEADAAFAIIIEDNFLRPSTIQHAKQLAKWHSELSEEFIHERGLLYEAKQEALKQVA